MDPVSRIIGVTQSCPICGGRALNIGKNRFRGNTTYQCISCHHRYTINEYD